MKTTREIIESQLLENTGKHMLDSGGAYGRHWEQNQKTGIDFNEGLRISKYGVTIPIAVFMDTMLSRDEFCEVIEHTAKVGEIELRYWEQDKVKEMLLSLGCEDIENWFNTYNWDNDLSQDLQGVIFEYRGQKYAIIETHNGCDIRGGYSDGRVYMLVKNNCGVKLNEKGIRAQSFTKPFRQARKSHNNY